MTKDLEDIEVTEQMLESVDDSVPLFKAALEAEVDAHDWSVFSSSVMSRVDAAIEEELASPDPALQLVREDAARQLANKDGQWSAFAHQVFAETAREERHTAGLDLAARVRLELEAEVESELEAVEPRFEKAFRRGVERRIEASPRGWFDAVRAMWAEARDNWGMGVGFATAGAAVFLLLVFAPRIETPPERLAPSVNVSPPGEVLVEEVNFQGDVMVMQGEGVTFVYLSDSDQS